MSGQKDNEIKRLHERLDRMENLHKPSSGLLLYCFLASVVAFIAVAIVQPSLLPPQFHEITKKASSLLHEDIQQQLNEIREQQQEIRDALQQLLKLNEQHDQRRTLQRQCRPLVLYRHGTQYPYKGVSHDCTVTQSNLQRWINHEVTASPAISKFFTSTGRDVPPVLEFPAETEEELERPLLIVALQQHEQFIWPAENWGETITIQAGSPPQKVGVKTLSKSPRIFELSNLLTAEECDHMLEFARTLEKTPSKVGADSKNSILSSASRTSTHTWLGRHARGLLASQWQTDDIINRIEDRIFDLTALTGDTAEPFQVVWYNKTQYYFGHHDYSTKATTKENPYYQGGGNRLVTVLLYLNDVEEGGETSFPFVDKEGNPVHREMEPTDLYKGDSACVVEGIRVKPHKGGAVMFYNLKENGHMDGEPDPYSLHAGCPVTKGEKFVINKWIRNKRVDGKLYDSTW